MNSETKLRIHNITPKEALKFGSEIWALKKRDERLLEEHRRNFRVTVSMY